MFSDRRGRDALRDSRWESWRVESSIPGMSHPDRADKIACFLTLLEGMARVSWVACFHSVSSRPFLQVWQGILYLAC